MRRCWVCMWRSRPPVRTASKAQVHAEAAVDAGAAKGHMAGTVTGRCDNKRRRQELAAMAITLLGGC